MQVAVQRIYYYLVVQPELDVVLRKEKGPVENVQGQFPWQRPARHLGGGLFSEGFISRRRQSEYIVAVVVVAHCCCGRLPF